MRSAQLVLVCTVLMAACSQVNSDQLDTQITAERGEAIALHDSVPSADPIGITFGSSAGMCLGYCEHEFVLHSWGISGVRKAHSAEEDSKPDQTIWSRIDQEDLEVLLLAIDTSDLGDSYEVLGCPDCADGGSCWLKINRNGMSKFFNYDCSNGAGRLRWLTDRLWAWDPSPPDNADALLMPGLPKWE